MKAAVKPFSMVFQESRFRMLTRVKALSFLDFGIPSATEYIQPEGIGSTETRAH